MEMTTATHMPQTPLGKKPPCPVRWRAPNSERPLPHTTQAPSRMKPAIARILMVENQYSTVPKVFTLQALTPMSTPEKSTIQIHGGTVVNQNCM